MLTRTLYRYEKHQQIYKTDQECGKTGIFYLDIESDESRVIDVRFSFRISRKKTITLVLLGQNLCLNMEIGTTHY